MDNRIMSQARLLHQLRKEHKLSQDAVAKGIGVSRPTYISLEKGKRELTLSEAERVSRMFDIPLDDIVLGRKPKSVSKFFKNTPSTIEKKSDIRVSIPQENIKKFKQVLLYLLAKTAGKPNVGMTVLYKLLYFIDFDYYEKYGEQLMGLRYMRNTHGPTPKSFAVLVKNMKEKGELEEVQSSYFTYEQRKFLPIKDADLSVLSGRELEMIEDVLARYADKNATELSSLTHEDTPWVASEPGDDLKYEHVFYRPDKLSIRSYEEL